MTRLSTLLLSAATALASPAALAAGISDDVVKIGVLTDMTGIFSDLAGKGSIAAAEMAIDDFKAAEKPDFAIELISSDHQNKPDVASAAARGWYDTEKVDLITDTINSAVALAVSKIAETKERMLIVTGSGTTLLTNEQCSPNTISYGWDTYSYSNAQARIVDSLGLDSWYFIAVDYALGKSLVAEATRALEASGGTVAGTVNYPIGATDFSSFMLQAQGSGAKVVGLANAGTDLHNAIKAANEFGIVPGQTVVPLVGTIIDVHALGPALTQGMYMVEPFYWNIDDKTREWSLRFREKAGTTPGFVHAGTYSAVTNYLKAVKAVGTDEAQAVMAELKSMDINDDVFARNAKIRDDGRMVKDIYLVQVKGEDAMAEDWDYFEVKEVIPADDAFQPLSTSRCKMVTN